MELDRTQAISMERLSHLADSAEKLADSMEGLSSGFHDLKGFFRGTLIAGTLLGVAVAVIAQLALRAAG